MAQRVFQQTGGILSEARQHEDGDAAVEGWHHLLQIGTQRSAVPLTGTHYVPAETCRTSPDTAALLSDLGGLADDPVQKTVIMLMERMSALEDQVKAMAARESARDADTVRFKTIEALASDLGRGSIWRARNTGMTLEQFRDKVAHNISAAAACGGGSFPGFQCVVIASYCGTYDHVFTVFQVDRTWKSAADASVPSAVAGSSWIDVLGAVRSSASCTERMISWADTCNESISDRFERLVNRDDGTIWCGWMDLARPGQMLWERGEVGKAVCNNDDGIAPHQPLSPWAQLRVSRLTPQGDAVTRIMRNISWELQYDPSSAAWVEDDYPWHGHLLTAAQSSEQLSDEEMRIVVDLDRWGRQQALIIVRPPDTTVAGVLNAIHAFYHAPRTLTDLQRLSNDMFNYVQHAIVDMQDGKGPRAYASIRGDSIHFEGLHRLKDGTYTLRFGS